MPDAGSRIDLWRKAIYLFHKVRARSWEGPFYRAGYRQYRIEPILLDEAGEEYEPDIVGVSEAWWTLLELTTNPSSKQPKIEDYANIRSEGLSNIGLEPKEHGPVLAVGRPEPVENEAVPRFILGEELAAEHVGDIEDETLAHAVRQVEGESLSGAPDIALAFVPESRSMEIRRGLVPLVMQMFQPGRPTMRPVDLAEAGLERLADRVRTRRKRRVIERVHHEMETLLDGNDPHLSEYIEEEGGIYRAKEDAAGHHGTRDKIRRILQAWAEGRTRLTDYLDEEDEEEGHEDGSGEAGDVEET